MNDPEQQPQSLFALLNDGCGWMGILSVTVVPLLYGLLRLFIWLTGTEMQ